MSNRVLRAMGLDREMFTTLVAYVFAMTLATATGCGSGDTAKISGTVVFEGRGVHPGVIRFWPERGGRPIASGLDEQGGFAAKLPPDRYKISIEPGLKLPPDWKEGDAIPPDQPTVPPKFESRETSGLTVEVPTGTARLELPTFDLK